MSHNHLVNAQPMLARRRFLQLMASTTLGATLLAACKPITRPVEAPTASSAPATGSLKLQKVVTNGVELHYLEQGQGDPLVLLHGGLADYREWGPQMDRFAQHYRVIAYSQRYYYPNQNLPIVDDYTTLVDVADLTALLQALDLAPSHLVGYSSGAFMALAMALDHPEMVHSLVLAEPPIIRWTTDPVLTEFMAEFWEPVRAAFRQGDKELALRTSIEFFIGADVLDELPAEVRQTLAACRRREMW